MADLNRQIENLNKQLEKQRQLVKALNHAYKQVCTENDYLLSILKDIRKYHPEIKFVLPTDAKAEEIAEAVRSK